MWNRWLQLVSKGSWYLPLVWEWESIASLPSGCLRRIKVCPSSAGPVLSFLSFAIEKILITVRICSGLSQSRQTKTFPKTMNPIGFQRLLVINLLDLTRETMANLPLSYLRLTKVSTRLWLSLVVLVSPCRCLSGRICLSLTVFVYVCRRHLNYIHSCDWRNMISVLIYCICSSIRSYIYMYICVWIMRRTRSTHCAC